MFSAGERLESIQKSKAGEIAKLQALLRKAEMRVTSLERAVEQKVSSSIDWQSEAFKIVLRIYLNILLDLFQTHENQELTTICDELISKVGTS